MSGEGLANGMMAVEGVTMLTKVAIGNFKSLRDVQIDLERFTVFAGPSALGKSSICSSTAGAACPSNTFAAVTTTHNSRPTVSVRV